MNKSVVLKLLGCTLVLGTFNCQASNKIVTEKLNPVQLDDENVDNSSFHNNEKAKYYLNLAKNDLKTIEILGKEISALSADNSIQNAQDFVLNTAIPNLQSILNNVNKNNYSILLEHILIYVL